MITCRICGNDKENAEFIVREMMYGLRETFKYFECSCCGCLQIADIPSDLSKYYPSNYYSFNAAVDSASSIKKLLKRIRDNFAVFDKGILGRILYRFNPDVSGLKSLAKLALKKDMRIIDVGCGDGKLLCSLREIGFRNLLGVDPFVTGDIDYSNGVRIVKNDLANIDGAWDVVMFHHSFEHIFDQLGVLNSVNRVLNDNGTCIIRVPITSSFAWRHYGVNWVQLDAPRHFFLHSIKSMNILAEQAGFRIEHIMYDSTGLQFIGSELYVKDLCLFDVDTGGIKTPSSFFSPSELRKFSAETKLLNERHDGDQAVFYLRKNIQGRESMPK